MFGVRIFGGGLLGGSVISLQERSLRPATVSGFTTDFSLSFARDHGAVVVGIVGELDCSTAAVLEERLADLLSDQGNLTVVLDLADMTFVDSSGLSVFLTAYRHLRGRGGTLCLRHPSASTMKVFAITGLDRLLAIDDL
ncbi:MAG TPA: STAS domain-containing protein [Acidimicrobiales bacterium]|nr:STAS domain-containing protein [Acidimicrobiales bacterium]